jgi:hypothetical protein
MVFMSWYLCGPSPSVHSIVIQFAVRILKVCSFKKVACSFHIDNTFSVLYNYSIKVSTESIQDQHVIPYFCAL